MKCGPSVRAQGVDGVDARRSAALLRPGSLALLDFRETYNTIWLTRRLGYRIPDAVR